MKLTVKMTKDSTSEKYDSQSAILLATAVLLAMSQYFSKLITFDARDFQPVFLLPGLLEMNGTAVECLTDSVLPKTNEELLESLHDVAWLYASTDTFLSTINLKRSNWLDDPRYPVRLVSGNTLNRARTFEYDEPSDTLTCGLPNWEARVDESSAMLKALANASAAGYKIEIILDGKTIALPAAHTKWFSYKSGPGKVYTASALLFGLLINGQIVELKIDNGRVQQASVSDEAMPAIANCTYPSSCFIRYSLASCYSPLERKAGKITIERITEVREHREFDFQPRSDEI